MTAVSYSLTYLGVSFNKQGFLLSKQDFIERQ